MGHLQWILVCLFVYYTLFHTSVAVCQYNLQSDTIATLAKQCVNPTDVVVFSTMDIGTAVSNFVLKKGSDGSDALLMVSKSSNYDLNFVEDYFEVVVKKCLQVGEKEYLAFSVNETLRYSDCGAWILETVVEPSKPNFTIPSSVDVNVSSCLPEVDVFELQFHNGGNCSSWNCSAECTNDAKIFLIEGKTVRISVENIIFNFTYEITVTCFDYTASSNNIDNTTDETSVSVTFVDAPVSCTDASFTTTTSTTPTAKPTTIITTTTALSTTSNQQTNEDLFQKPGNVAAIASFGGVLVGIPIGVVLHAVAKRFACKSAAVDNKKN